MDNNVDTKYISSKETIDNFKLKLIGDNVIGTTKPDNSTRHGQRDLVYNTYGVMGTLNATDYKQPKQPKQVLIQDLLDENVDDKYLKLQPKVKENFDREYNDIIKSGKNISNNTCIS